MARRDGPAARGALNALRRRLALAGLLAAGAAQAAIPGFCSGAPELDAAQQDRLLRISALMRAELDASGRAVAVVARSGLDLDRFGLRYSHAGLALAQGAGSPWAVRQLYYACDEGRPRLFDQGLTGFLAGTRQPERGHLSALLLPAEAAATLAAAALDRPRALDLVAGSYSANAHAWSLRHQNCNQWLVELMAAAFGALPGGPDLRARAQGWLREAGYRPAAVDAGAHWVMFAAGFVPWLRFDDRPEDERHSLVFQVSVPASIETFVRARWPAAERVELCHDGARVVLRRGWTPIAEGCVAAPGDREVTL